MEPFQTGQVSAPSQWMRPSRGPQDNVTVFTKIASAPGDPARNAVIVPREHGNCRP